MFSKIKKFFTKNRICTHSEIIPKGDYNVMRYIRLYSLDDQEDLIRRRLNHILEEYLILCANKQNVFNRNKRKVIFDWSGKSGISLIIWLLRVYLGIETNQAYTIMKAQPDTVRHVFFPAEINNVNTPYWAKWELIISWKFSNKRILRVIKSGDIRNNISFHIDRKKYYYLEWISLRRDAAAGDMVITFGGERVRAHSTVLENYSIDLPGDCIMFAVQACLEYLYLGYISDWDRFGPDEKYEIEKVAKEWNLDVIKEMCS